jgi:hypothetical protein
MSIQERIQGLALYYEMSPEDFLTIIQMGEFHEVIAVRQLVDDMSALSAKTLAATGQPLEIKFDAVVPRVVEKRVPVVAPVAVKPMLQQVPKPAMPAMARSTFQPALKQPGKVVIPSAFQQVSKPAAHLVEKKVAAPRVFADPNEMKIHAVSQAEYDELFAIALAQEETLSLTDAAMARALYQENTLEASDMAMAKMLARDGAVDAESDAALAKILEQDNLVDSDAALARALSGNGGVGVVSGTASDSKLAAELAWEEEKSEFAARRIQDEEDQKQSEAVIDPSNRIQVRNIGGGSVLCYKCPHCSQRVLTYQAEIACTIVTHGATSTGQVPQHVKEADVGKIQNVVVGCLKQYTLQVNGDGTYRAEICKDR